MNLFNFLDLKYRNTALALQKEFNIYQDGKAKAIHSMINFMRSLGKWTSFPALLGEFFLVKLHLIKAPTEPELISKKELKPSEIDPVSAT